MISLKLSVHQLVDFLLRKGDIDSRVFNKTTMNEGSRLHLRFQEEQGEDFFSEYQLKSIIKFKDYEILLEGRSDGVRKTKKGYCIEEIKTTTQDLNIFMKEHHEWHKGQAICYAYMLCNNYSLEKVNIKLIYLHQVNKQKRCLSSSYCFNDLKDYVFSLLEEYLSFYNIIEEKNKKKIKTTKTIGFPFQEYRNGQRELAKYCYSIAKKGGKLFVEAPTGIGKTMSTIFPFIKAINEFPNLKIFYLTAKNSGKNSAINALELLKSSGLEITYLAIKAKEKICFEKGASCNPDECIFAKNYYDKLNTILRKYLIENSSFDSELIEKIAKENSICPFEFQLDLSLFSDIIICDYNYVFDPQVYLKRFFDVDASNALLLVDESHNLIERSKSMYSASVDSFEFYRMKEEYKKSTNKNIKSMINKLSSFFQDFVFELDEKETIVDDFSSDLYKALSTFCNTYQILSKDHSKDITQKLSTFYLDCNSFLKISELVDDNYLSYAKLYKKGRKPLFLVKHFCVDPSRYLKAICNKVRGTVFFSATFSPISYFISLLGGNNSVDPYLLLPSPFDRTHLKLLISENVSITYNNRASSYKTVSEYILEFTSHRIGNYFIYFPSYEYLDNILPLLSFPGNTKVYIQKKDMSESEREEFLVNFAPLPKETTIGLAVIGGAFAEGIDLVSDRLIGAVVIGVGLPKINFESNYISRYYDDLGEIGDDYAYTLPGFNKVMQAVGRVIRGENEYGAVLLIDDRYQRRHYKSLFRPEWADYKVVNSKEDIKDELSNFFKK